MARRRGLFSAEACSQAATAEDACLFQTPGESGRDELAPLDESLKGFLNCIRLNLYLDCDREGKPSHDVPS
jgi:hypothetical protein